MLMTPDVAVPPLPTLMVNTPVPLALATLGDVPKVLAASVGTTVGKYAGLAVAPENATVPRSHAPTLKPVAPVGAGSTVRFAALTTPLVGIPVTVPARMPLNRPTVVTALDASERI